MEWQGVAAEHAQPSAPPQHADTVDDLRDDDAVVRAQVADLSATVASQLSEITAEMNRIRAAMGSEAEIGDIQAELDALRAQLTSDGHLRRRPGSVPARDDSLDGWHDRAQTDQPRLGLITSIVVVVLMLAGPLWPLTAQAIASLSRESEQTPWYDQVVSDR